MVARRAWQELGEAHWVGESTTLIGVTAAALGRIDEAEAHYCEALDILRHEGSTIAVAGALSACATLAARKGDFRRAAMLAGDSLHLVRDTGEDPSMGFATGLTLAEALAMLGQPVHAARLLGAVESYENRLGIAETELEGSQLQRLLDLIHTRATQDDIATARAEGQRLPLAEWLPWAIDLAHCIETAAVPPGPSEALTARETDVLRLVAAGCSNREIADILSRSERTIENHMTHILAKLNVSSRTAAVAFATREGMI
jgi:ATP/maltotriose-dependent transcriptional regulator MalT